MASNSAIHKAEDTRPNSEISNSITSSDSYCEIKPGDMFKGKGPLSNRAYKRLKRQGLLDSSQKAKKQKICNGDKDLKSVPKDLDAETSYFFENGLRKVHPYYFTFSSYAKKRWQGRTLVDIFSDEFRQENIKNYEKLFSLGRVRINAKPATMDYVVKNGDFLENILHRHEVPVTDEAIEIVENSEKVLVINKPSSIPCHPCGRYRHNSIPFILSKEHGLRNLRGIYRLDRMTSGLLIFCKDTATTNTMMSHIRDRLVTKHYLAKVVGCFPSEVVECREAIAVLTHKLGLHHVSGDGKEAHTTFQRLSTDGQCSIVKCSPHTGRTHQIRVHLQYLGFPIVNDDLYNSSAWGAEKGKGANYGKTKDQLIQDLFHHHDRKNHLRTTVQLSNADELEPDISLSGAQARSDVIKNSGLSMDDVHHSESECQARYGCTNDKETIDVQAKGEHFDQADEQAEDNQPLDAKTITSHSMAAAKNAPGGAAAGSVATAAESGVDPHCEMCAMQFRDPQPHELVMYLHAYHYAGPGWSFSTPMPHWATMPIPH